MWLPHYVPVIIILYTANVPPSNVVAEQTGPDTVLVTWTPPPAPPAAGYQVQVTAGTTTTTNVTGTSHNISVNNQFGVYSIKVISLHLPSEAIAPVELTVRGMDQVCYIHCKQYCIIA